MSTATTPTPVIESNLSYNASMKERSYLDTSGGSIKSNAHGKIVRTSITNARNVNDIILDDIGFQLVQHSSSLNNNDYYNNNDMIINNYYNEINDLLKRVTGATDAICYHHQIRNNDKVNHNSIQGYALGVHTDYTSYSANDLFLKLYQSEVQPKKGRFAIINVWRNISDTPVAQNDIALLDERSLVKPDDYIELEFTTDTYSTLQYRLNDTNSSKHRWYYYPSMTKDEVLLFKQYDSKTDIGSRFCFHTAMNTLGDSYPTRESIEIRAIVFFADDAVNSCPERVKGYDYLNTNKNTEEVADSNKSNPFSIFGWLFSTLGDVSVEEGARRCENAIVYLSYWPKDIVAYIKAGKNRPEAALELAQALADDKKNHLKIRHLKKEKKADIVKRLMDNGWEKKFQVAFA